MLEERAESFLCGKLVLALPSCGGEITSPNKNTFQLHRYNFTFTKLFLADTSLCLFWGLVLSKQNPAHMFCDSV